MAPKYELQLDDLDIPKCPKELLYIHSLPAKLSIIEQRNDFTRIDKLLGNYYHQFGINNYFNDAGNGRFLQYIIDNNLTSIDLTDHNKADNLKYIYFDPKFPLNNETLIYVKKNNIHKKHVIFYVIQYCFNYNAYPPPNRYLQYMVLETNKHSCQGIDWTTNVNRRNTTAGTVNYKSSK
eukprot:744038_1